MRNYMTSSQEISKMTQQRLYTPIKRDWFFPSLNVGRGLVRHKKVTPLQAVVDLYHATIDAHKFDAVTIPYELYDFAYQLYTLFKQDINLISTDTELIRQDYPQDNELAICLFSGGMDSSAVVYQQRHNFKTIKLFYLDGVNCVYYREMTAAMRVAKRLQEISSNIEITFMDATSLPKPKNTQESSVKKLIRSTTAMTYYQIKPKVLLRGDSDHQSYLKDYE